MKNEIKINYQNRLPHIAPIGATFFVTFRLHDSLPRPVVESLRERMNRAIEQLKKDKPPDYQEKIKNQRKLFFKHYDQQLDRKPYGECYLRKPAVAKIVADKLHELDGDKYDLITYCIMSNHVHVLFDTSKQLVDENNFFLPEVPEDYTQLHQIMKLIKGATAYAANRLLGRKGAFWQKDSYDHYVRNEKEFWNIVYYILRNPVKAGMVAEWKDFPYSYLKREFGELV